MGNRARGLPKVAEQANLANFMFQTLSTQGGTFRITLYSASLLCASFSKVRSLLGGELKARWI